MSQTQSWQQLKNLLSELPPDTLETIRTIEVETQNYFSRAELAIPSSIDDLGTPEDTSLQTWGQLINILNDADPTALEQTRTINIEGSIYNSEATLSDDGGPLEVKDTAKPPTG